MGARTPTVLKMAISSKEMCVGRKIRRGMDRNRMWEGAVHPLPRSLTELC